MKKLIFILLVGNLFSEQNSQLINKDNAQSDTSTSIKNIIKYRNNKHNLSFGLFDSRIGNTFISYSYDIVQNNKLNNELFIGLGTAVITTNMSLGYKQYYTTRKRSIFSVMSLHLSAVTLDPDWDKPNQIGIFPTMALGLERIFNKYSIQYGLFFAYMKTDYGYEYGLIPFINFDYRF
tara:strand:- start:54 stop:587 length:534 start_codon:yes stop_codon:yes gene_type:complete